MIQQVLASSFVWQCPVCHSSYETLYSALTLGDDNSVGFFSAPACVTCGAILCYTPSTNRATIADLALAEILDLAKGVASYYGAYAAADVTTYLTGRSKLSTYVTIPADLTGKTGHLHYQAAQAQYNGPQLAALIKAGFKVFGTDAYVRTIVAKVAAGDEQVRRQLLGSHGLAY